MHADENGAQDLSQHKLASHLFESLISVSKSAYICVHLRFKMTKDYINQGFVEVIDAGVSEIASDAKVCETIRHDCSKLAETQPQRRQRSCRSFYLDNFRYKFAVQFP